MGLKNEKIDVGRGVGKGFLNVIRDLGLREYYQSSVELQTGEIARDLAYYLNVSEQIPSAVSLGVYVEPDNSVKAAGGFMIQTMPETRTEIVEFLERKLSETQSTSSMILQGMDSLQILEEVVDYQLRFCTEALLHTSAHAQKIELSMQLLHLEEKKFRK